MTDGIEDCLRREHIEKGAQRRRQASDAQEL